MSIDLIEVEELLADLIGDLRDGKIKSAIEASRRLMNIAIDAIPVDELKESLTPRDRAWADLAVDIAESIKVNAMADQAETAKIAASPLAPPFASEDDEEIVPE